VTTVPMYAGPLGARIDDDGDLLLTFAIPEPGAIVNCGRPAAVARKVEAFDDLVAAASFTLFDIRTPDDVHQSRFMLRDALLKAGILRAAGGAG
jgi:hypothetical protein